MAKKEKTYNVRGMFDGRNINVNVNASKPRQAKLRAGFILGFGGYQMRPFMSSRSVKVTRA